MVDEFGDRQSIPWVFGEAAQDEVLYLGRGWLAARKVNILLDHLDHFLLSPDLEGHPSISQFVGQDAEVPNIDLVVVVLFLDYFWRGVEGCAAAGVPQQG